MTQEGSNDFTRATDKIEEFQGRERASVSQQLDKRSTFLSERQLTDAQLSSARMVLNPEVSGSAQSAPKSDTTQNNNPPQNPQSASTSDGQTRGLKGNTQCPGNAQNQNPNNRGRRPYRSASNPVERLLDYILDPAEFPPLGRNTRQAPTTQNQKGKGKGKGKRTNSRAPTGNDNSKRSRSSSPSTSNAGGDFQAPPRQQAEAQNQPGGWEWVPSRQRGNRRNPNTAQAPAQQAARSLTIQDVKRAINDVLNQRN